MLNVRACSDQADMFLHLFSLLHSAFVFFCPSILSFCSQMPQLPCLILIYLFSFVIFYLIFFLFHLHYFILALHRYKDTHKKQTNQVVTPIVALLAILPLPPALPTLRPRRYHRTALLHLLHRPDHWEVQKDLLWRYGCHIPPPPV